MSSEKVEVDYQTILNIFDYCVEHMEAKDILNCIEDKELAEEYERRGLDE